jgi:hypothetical protein
MKNRLFVFALILVANTNCSSPTKEDFESFFYRFATDNEFQLRRVKFPLEYRTWKDPSGVGSEIETRWINKRDWEHEYFFMNDTYRPQIYDNFEGQLKDSNERLFQWIGIETGVDVKYFFKRDEGKWYLIKK